VFSGWFFILRCTGKPRASFQKSFEFRHLRFPAGMAHPLLFEVHTRQKMETPMNDLPTTACAAPMPAGPPSFPGPR